MTVHLEDKYIPGSSREICVGVTCDRCDKRDDGALPRARGEIAWATGVYDVRETTLSMKEGTCYPDGGGQATTFRFDICPLCMRDWLLPLIEAELGKPPHKDDVES